MGVATPTRIAARASGARSESTALATTWNPPKVTWTRISVRCTRQTGAGAGGAGAGGAVAAGSVMAG
jgi:hypothetical protein